MDLPLHPSPTDPLATPALQPLRRLRDQCWAASAADRPAAEAQLLAWVLATRPAPAAPRLPWSQRLAMAALVLCLGLAGYAWKGNVAGWSPAPAADPAEQMVQRLAARLQAAGPGGGSAADWAMLGRSQAVLGRQDQALQAYRRALALGGDDADLLADLADLQASAQGGSLEGEPAAWLQRALAQQPQHTKALALAATRAWRAGESALATTLWQRLVDSAPADHPLLATARASLQQARASSPQTPLRQPGQPGQPDGSQPTAPANPR